MAKDLARDLRLKEDLRDIREGFKNEDPNKTLNMKSSIHTSEEDIEVERVPTVQDFDEDPYQEDSFEYEINAMLEIQKKKIDRKQQLEKQVIEYLNLDFKPYMAEKTLNNWGQRLKRIEMKMTALDPELVSLSISLHERAINLVFDKIVKFQKKEEKFMRIIDHVEKQLERARAKRFRIAMNH